MWEQSYVIDFKSKILIQQMPGSRDHYIVLELSAGCTSHTNIHYLNKWKLVNIPISRGSASLFWPVLYDDIFWFSAKQ